MRVPRIPRPLLKTKISTYRESKSSQTDTGSWNTSTSMVLSDIRAHIQSDDDQLEYELAGKKHISTHECQFDRYYGGVYRDVKPGDILYDHTLGKRMLIIGVNEEYSEIRTDGYYDLKLKFLGNDDRFSFVTRQTMRARARIKTDSGTQQNIDVKAKIING